MKNSIKLTSTNYFITLINGKYFIDSKIEFTYDGEHGKTAGVAFLKHLDDSNEYGESVGQQLIIRASGTSNTGKKIIKEMIYDFYESLKHSEIIIKHLKENMRFFEKRIENGKKVDDEAKNTTFENPEDDF